MKRWIVAYQKRLLRTNQAGQSNEACQITTEHRQSNEHKNIGLSGLFRQRILGSIEIHSFQINEGKREGGREYCRVEGKKIIIKNKDPSENMWTRQHAPTRRNVTKPTRPPQLSALRRSKRVLFF
jgi:hypothetical protein